MKISIITVIITILISSLFFISCKKKANKVVTKSEILTSHKWRLFRLGQTSDDISITWQTSTDSCITDDTWEIKNDGQLIWDNNSMKCSPNDPQFYYNGTWQLISNDSIIRLNNGNNNDLKVINITENSLTVIELDSFYPHDCYDLLPY